MQPRRAAGFTLPGLLVSFTLLGIVITGIVGSVVTTQRGYVRQREAARSADALNLAEATITAALRSAGANAHNLTGATAPRLDPDPLNHGAFDNLRVVADFNPPDADVTDVLEDMQMWVASDTLFVRWQDGQTGEPLAYPVRSMLFEYFARDGSPIAVATDIDRATRVKLTLTTPRHPLTGTVARRETWVYLRNH